MKKAKLVIGLITALVGAIVTGYLHLDSRHAQAKDLTDATSDLQGKIREVKQDVEEIRLEGTYQKALDQKYNYRNLKTKYPDDEEIQEEYEKANEEAKFLKEKLKKFKKKGQ